MITNLRQLDELRIPEDLESCQKLREDIKGLLAQTESEILQFNLIHVPGVKTPSARKFGSLAKSTVLGKSKQELTLRKMGIQRILRELREKIRQLQVQQAERKIAPLNLNMMPPELSVDKQLLETPFPDTLQGCHELLERLKVERVRISQLLRDIDNSCRRDRTTGVIVPHGSDIHMKQRGEHEPCWTQLHLYHDALGARFRELGRVCYTRRVDVILQSAEMDMGHLVGRGLALIRSTHELLLKKQMEGVEFSDKDKHLVQKLADFLEEMAERQRRLSPI